MQNILSKITKITQSGFIHVMIGNTLLKFVNMLSAIFVARILSKSEMGLLSYVDNIYSYFIAIAGFGVAGGILRYCSITKDDSKEVAYFNFGLKFGTIFQGVLTGVIIIISLFVPFPFEHTKDLMIFFAVFPILNFLYEYLSTFLRVELKFKEYSSVIITYSVILIAFIITLAKSFKIYGIITARYIAVVFGLIILYILISKIIKAKSANISPYNLNKVQKKEFLSYCFASLCSVALSIVLPLNEAFLINNILKNDVISANYKVAVTIPQGLTFITSSVMMFAIPYFAKNEHDKKWLSKNYRLLQLSLAVFCAISAVIYCLCSKFIIQIIFGDKYVEVALLSSMLFIAHSINAGFRMISLNILLALGYAKFNAYMAFYTVIIQIIVDCILIALWGAFGAVFGITFVYLVTGIIACKFLHNKIRSIEEV